MQLFDPVLPFASGEPPAVHHAQRETVDSHLHASIVQVAAYRQKPERINLKHGGQGDHVAYRSVQDRMLGRIVDAQCMQEQQIKLSFLTLPSPQKVLLQSHSQSVRLLRGHCTLKASVFATVFSLTSPKFKSDHIVSRINSCVELGEINMPAKYESHRASFARALRPRRHSCEHLAKTAPTCIDCHKDVAHGLSATPARPRPNHPACHKTATYFLLEADYNS
jgi:hypothetical protein